MPFSVVSTTPPINCKLDKGNSHRTVAEFKRKKRVNPRSLFEDSLLGTQ